jgi:hypothetical protein
VHDERDEVCCIFDSHLGPGHASTVLIIPGLREKPGARRLPRPIEWL